jgi:LmbE family N-acetylglucosaminyl deacetylase
MRSISFSSVPFALIAMSMLAFAKIPQAPPKLPPDERFKTDILLITSHPDDQIQISAYLAKAIYDEHRRVAVVFANRGNSGGNANGYEQAAALGEIMDIEGREAMAALGVMKVWYLPGTDVPGQDLLRSLEAWHHGNVLEETVRLIRLTRPEVILTMLPMYSAGENHGDHQATGTVATEAFDLAGDPTAFPEQVAHPRDHTTFGNLTEGLQPWQPKKLYYFSDASHTEFMEGQGPKYSATEVSPSRRVPYCQFMAEQLSFYRTQFPGYHPRSRDYQALARGDFQSLPEFDRTWLLPWTYFIVGKSLVKANVTGDIFEGITPGPVPFAPVRGYRPPARQGISLELGGPFAFYRDFWPAHNLEHLADLLAPEVELPGDTLHIPLLIHNDSGEAAEVMLYVKLPPGWTERTGTARYPVAAHDTYPVNVVLGTPESRTSDWVQVRCDADVNGRHAGSVTMRVRLVEGALPQ